MKVFQELRTAIDEWEKNRDTILKDERELNCIESEIMGKIEQLKTARPAGDLNSLNDKLEELMAELSEVMNKAEDISSQIENAQSEIEYCSPSDTTASLEDVTVSFDELRKSVRKELDGNKE